MVFIDFLYPQDIWQQAGGPYGGTIWTISIDSSNNVFVGTENGGIYYSTDYGNSWKQLGLNHYSIDAIIFDANHTIYASTQGPDGFKSTDNGKTWIPLARTPDDAVGILYINSKGILFASNSNGIYKSFDKGNSWIRIDTITNFSNAIMAFDKNDNMFAASEFGHLYYSTDDGRTWIQTPVKANCITITPSNTIYVGNDKGIYKSDDLGKNWLYLTNSPQPNIKGITSDSNGYVFAYSWHSDTVKNSAMYRSTDGGNTWENINKGIFNNDFQALISDNKGNIYAGFIAGGIYRSTNDGDIWETKNFGLNNTPIVTLELDSKGDLYAGTNNGLYISTDLGKSWMPPIFIDTLIQVIKIDAENNIHLVATDWNDSTYIFNSQYSDRNWNHVSFYDRYGVTYISSLIETNKDTLYAGTVYGDILRSIDNGQTWISLDGDNGLPAANRGTYDGVSLSYSSNCIFASYSTLGLFRTTDNGANWSNIFSKYGSYNIEVGDVEVYKKYIYLSWGTADPTTGLFDISTISVSTDNGDTWGNSIYCGGGAFNTDLFGHVFYVPYYDNPSLIYYSDYLFNKTGQFSDQDISFVSCFNTDSKGNIYAGTYGHGVYKSNISFITNVKATTNEKMTYNLSQNFPNPFNPVTTIKYSILKTSFVTIKVYDVLGREVETLVNEEKPSGTYKVEFNGNKLSSGIYFYRMQAGDFVGTKKINIVEINAARINKLSQVL